MNIHQLLSKIKEINADNLPGYSAQLKMSSKNRPVFNKNEVLQRNPKKSAVNLMIYEKNKNAHLVFIQRHDYKGVHSGQIAFPGGKFEDGDTSFAMTALRETEEEIGIQIKEQQILFPLTELYVPPSNFVIYPFVSHLNEQPIFKRQESEVKAILEFSIADLLNKEFQKKYLYRNQSLNIQFETPSYQINNHVIWGATAMILSEFLSLIE